MATTKKLAVGRQVAISSLRSDKLHGKVTEIRDSARGTWVSVNVSDDKKKPVIRSYRVSELTVV